jgi:hypothetical protein
MIATSDVQEIEDTSKKVPFIEVITPDNEKKIMLLNPGESKVFFGDCKIVIRSGTYEISNPLRGDIHLTRIPTNAPYVVFLVDGLIFRVKAGEKALKFSLIRKRIP